MENQDLPQYVWNKNLPPHHLKSKGELKKLGLVPLKPVGILHERLYDALLYDINNPESVKKKKPLSKKKLAEKREKDFLAWDLRNWEYYHDMFNAVRWARKILENKKEYVILDTETTGLGLAEIVQIGVINLDGKIILDSLVKPSISIPSRVTAIHGIDDNMVIDAPSFYEIYPQIYEALRWKNVLIYNANFDINVLGYCCRKFNRFPLELKARSECVMKWYAQFFGEWNDYHKSYKWQPLYGGHNAISDCLACLDLINEMANTEILTSREIFDSRYPIDDEDY